jgi:uncharacterized protein YcbX
MKPTVAWVAVAPVKGLALGLVEQTELTEAGPHGDRRFFLVDENHRLVNSKAVGIFHQVQPSYDEATAALTLRLPGGTFVDGEVELAEQIDTHFWGTTLPARRVLGPWSDALSDLAGRYLLLVAPDRPAVDRGRSGAATLLSTGSLRSLAAELGVDDVDGRRFRMHFGVDGVEAHAEDAWVGRRVRIGDAVVIPQGNVGRCAVTTRNPDTGSPDLDTLKALAAYRRDVETTEPLPFGVYAAVAEPGPVRVGAPVELL